MTAALICKGAILAGKLASRGQNFGNEPCRVVQSWLRSSANSHARASFQQRATVSADTFRTCAVSSTQASNLPLLKSG